VQRRLKHNTVGTETYLYEEIVPNTTYKTELYVPNTIQSIKPNYFPNKYNI